VVFPAFWFRVRVWDVWGGRADSPVSPFYSSSWFGVFKPCPVVIYVPTTAAADLQFPLFVLELSMTIGWLHAVHGAISRFGTGCCQLQPEGGFFLSVGVSRAQGGSFLPSGTQKIIVECQIWLDPVHSMVIGSSSPVSLMDHPYFRWIIHTLNPIFTLPSMYCIFPILSSKF